MKPPFAGGFLKLGVHGVAKDGGACVAVLDPNGWATLAPDNRAFLPAIGDPCTTSELSKDEGYFYDTTSKGNLRLRLSADELRRMIMLALTPDEVLSLKKKHGIFHEIHEDFYDHKGRAVQPHTKVGKYIFQPKLDGGRWVLKSTVPPPKPLKGLDVDF